MGDTATGSQAAISPAPMLAVLGVAVIAFGFQQTGIVPAIPTVQRSLHGSREWSAWLQTGYLVASSIFTPVLGKLGDRMGKRRLLVAALATFLAGSVGAALSPGLAWLVGFRALQGAGGAVFPLALAIAREALPQDRIATGMGVLTGTFGIGTALGFVGGGAVVELLGWRWVFWAGAAAVAVAIALVAVAVPRSRARSEAGLGIPSALLLAGGLSAILVALTEGPSLGWTSGWVIGGFAAGAALLAGWVRHDLHAGSPLLDLRVLAEPPVLLANLGSLGLGFVMFGTYFLLPYLVEGSGRAGYGFGADALQTGLYLLPAAIGQLLAGPLAAPLAERLGSKWTFALGLALTAAACVLQALGHDDAAAVIAGAAVVGAGAGLAIGVASTLVAEAVEASDAGIATALNSVVRRVGGGVGGQVAAALMVATAVSGSATPSARAFTVAFWTLAGVGAVAALLAAGVRDAG